MIANMNNNGQKQLLAAIAALVMVVCAVAVVLPADSVEAVDMNTPTTGVTAEIDSFTDIPTTATSGIYVMSDDIDMSAAATIPTGVTVYTNGFNITSDAATDILTVNGTLYVNEAATPSDGSTLALDARSCLTGTGTWPAPARQESLLL